MVLADRGRGLVQEIAAGVADAGMVVLDAGRSRLPVIAELGFAAHGLLRFAQRGFVPPETFERRDVRPVRERGETGYAHVDADGAAVG